MPTLSMYVNDKIYKYLMDQGNPSSVGAKWVKERYERETKEATK